MATLSVKLVEVDGRIDTDASVSVFADALAAYQVEHELETETISDAIHAQFDAYPGASQNMPALVHGALSRLNVQPANYAAMEEKVLAFVRENSDRAAKTDKKTGTVTPGETPRTRLFGIRKGQGGGVVRWSDVPVKA